MVRRSPTLLVTIALALCQHACPYAAASRVNTEVTDILLSGSDKDIDSQQETLAWNERHDLAVGDKVVVHTAFQSNDKVSVALGKHLRGTVSLVDKDGDAKIDFEGQGLRWVLKSNFAKLAKLKFEEGDRVVIQKGFKSNSKSNPKLLAKGDRGRIKEIDKDGDAKIEFEKHGTQWVLSSNYFMMAKLLPSTEGFNLSKDDTKCISCIGFWGTYDPRPEYNLKSVSEILKKCSSSCDSRATSSLTEKDIKCVACSQFWSTYDARPEYNLQNVDEVLSECPSMCPQ